MAALPSSEPAGATRNTRSPPDGRPISSPTAPVSQNTRPPRDAVRAAGSEMVLP
jgi:hypothetical protein